MIDSISIIIPTRNRSPILARCLAALPEGAQNLYSPEVIVVDDCSGDSTPDVVREFGRISSWQVHHLRHERPLGANAARNVALKVARGGIIVFIDDDVIVTPGWLQQLVNGLSHDYPVVSGAVRLTVEGPILGKHREEVRALLGEILCCPTRFDGEAVPVLGNLAAYRWVFDRAGFDATIRPPVEEADWLRRAGVRARFVPAAWVWHYKTKEEFQLRPILAGVWRRGSEGGWWVRERLKLPFPRRLSMVSGCLKTSFLAFGHAGWRRCWGGAVVGLGELSRALALVGLINRGPRVPESWR
jgi:glycosyltransferase involved in cell wall biosynthesis